MAGSVVHGCTLEDGPDILFSPSDRVERIEIMRHAARLAETYLVEGVELPASMVAALDRARSHPTDAGNTPDP